ncbi:MAG: VWA domain-containing protein [Acidimicrobiia bacterium]|nr:VWA domain-containing protein [Acidimicrobiia bacterium]
MTTALADNLVHFVRYLRLSGLAVVPSTTLDLQRAAATLGWDDKAALKAGFRALTVVRRADIPAFDDAFELFFGSGPTHRRKSMAELELKIFDRQDAKVVTPVLRDMMNTGKRKERDDLQEHVGGSIIERLGRKDFAALTPEEIAEVRRIMATMVWRPADALGRRRMPSSRGDVPDMRRTFRSLSSPQADLIPLAMSSRKPRRRPLIVLADVSGSMDRYAEMFLYFMHAAQGRLGKVESFVFATHLTRVTREMRQPDPLMALRSVGRHVNDWSGGTRIGEALREFNWQWSRRLTRGGAVALIISDGWDCGDPEVLEVEMARFARSVHRVVWLNPLAGRTGYSAETQGLRIALPHVDDFLAAATINDLRSLVRLLETLPARRSSG